MLKIHLVLITLAAGLVIEAGVLTQARSPEVSVTGGRIHGLPLERGGAVFKGIPFAEPPLGKLRWREPIAIRPWSGTRNATAFGAPCPQTGSGFNGNASATYSEDCLTLNVWATAWPPSRRLPVMVWIHGGGNFAGASASDVYGNGRGNTYDGESLARNGVVLVSINYRLGTLGFFAHPELTAESPQHVSGNYGLLDQIAALRWIRDNIAAFGGDPGNVTIFGESSGAIDVGVLMTSPLAKGLFQRAIAESGTVSGEPRSLTEAEQDGRRLAQGLHAPQQGAVRYLRALNVSDLLNASVPLISASVTDWWSGHHGSLRRLVVDGYAVSRAPERVFLAGQEHAVPFIIGSNARERAPGATVPTDLAATLHRTYGPLADRAIALYGAASSDGTTTDPLYGTPADQWLGDAAFRCDSVLQALWHTRAGHPAYQYEFSRAAPGRESVGAVHTAEMWYVFGTLSLGTAPPGPTPRYDAVDQRLSATMQRYWTNFAKAGDPNDDKLPRWPQFGLQRRPFMQFGHDGPAAGEGLRRAYCEVYVENATRFRTQVP